MKKLLAIIVSAMLLSGCMTANMLEAERVPPATATPALWNGAIYSHFTVKETNMKDHILVKLDSTTELLQYFTGSVTTTQATKKYAATAIGSGLTAGEKVVFAGFSNADSNGTKTLATVAANEVTVEEAIGTGESGVTATVNQEWQGEWKEVDQFSHLLSTINTSGNAYAYVDQSADGVNTDYTTTITVTAATAKADSIEVLLPYARLRVRTNAADQTTMRAYLFGRRLT